MIDAILLFVATLATPVLPQTDTQPYFPRGVFSDDEKADKAQAEIVEGYLRAADEPSLFMSGDPGEIYRLLWVPPFHPPIAVRVTRTDPTPTMLSAIFQSTESDREPIVSTSRLSKSQWESFEEALKKSGFWASLSNRPEKAETIGVDPSYWVFEGRRKREYKIIQRSPPILERDQEFIDLGLSLLQLAGLDLEELGLLRNDDKAPAAMDVVQDDDLKDASILKVSLDCTEVDGHRVAVMGAASLEFEGRTLCPTKEFLSADRLNCLWLEVDQQWNLEDFKVLVENVQPGTYLYVEGRVSCRNRGFGDFYGAALESISVIISYESGAVLWSADGVGEGSQQKTP